MRLAELMRAEKLGAEVVSAVGEAPWTSPRLRSVLATQATEHKIWYLIIHKPWEFFQPDFQKLVVPLRKVTVK